MKRKKILFLSNHFITLYSFRRELIQQLLEDGHEVFLSMPAAEQNQHFTNLGCKIIETPMARRGTNPVQDIKLVSEYRKIMREVQPDIIFSYTIKPNIYGSMASNSLHLRQVCNVTGTGATFLNESWMSKLVRALYRVSMKKAYRVFFQNTGDKDYFVRHRLVNDNWAMLPGSGVNLEQHTFSEMPECATVNFIFIGRVMGVKGIDQYLDCAKAIRQKHSNTRFYIAGFSEEKHYKNLVEEYVGAGWVEYLGFQKDIDVCIKKCHCTILPSLGGEGVPNVLLESSAAGRVCIASNIPGSRDVVDDGITGYLFDPGSSARLIEKVQNFLSLSPKARQEIGRAAREKVEREFDRHVVIKKYCEEVEKA